MLTLSGVGVFPTDITPKVANLPTTSYPLFRRLFPYKSGALGETGEEQVEVRLYHIFFCI